MPSSQELIMHKKVSLKISNCLMYEETLPYINWPRYESFLEIFEIFIPNKLHILTSTTLFTYIYSKAIL